jgi:hypothetical protein
MRRWLVTAVLAFVALATLAPPVFAQAPAGPPAPKVTITGTFDQITSAGRNIYDGNFARDNDREWYARTRFRPDFEFAVGRTKAVLGIELDLNYGQTGSNDGGFPGNNAGTACGFTGGCKGAGSAGGGLDLNTDVAGLFEIKWIYTEFDLTGKDSLLPFIPVLTVARLGGQPFGTIANYKVYYANGDFAGLDLYTTFTPDIKNHFAYVIVEDQLAGGNRLPVVTAGNTATTQNRQSRGEDYAFIISPEFTPFKGLDLKPMFSWFHADGLTSTNARRNAFNLRTIGNTMNGVAAYAGSSTNLAAGTAGGDSTLHEERKTIGLDARWRIGAFGLDPTISYQWGSYETQAQKTNGGVGKVTGDASAWLFDAIASYQLGPLLLEARGTYSTGNKARDNLSVSKRYYEPLDLDTGFWSGGWLGILGLGVDYFNGGGGANLGMDSMVGYDRYGRGSFALRATYSLTPSLSFYGVVSPNWTAEKVDTNTGCFNNTTNTLNPGTSQNGCASRAAVAGFGRPSFTEGDSNYLGTEVNGGFTWRFAPNAAFDLAGYYLFAGSAMDQADSLNGAIVKRDAKDGYYAAARVRLSF